MLTQDRDEELVLFLEVHRLEERHQASPSKSDHSKSNTTTMSSQRFPLRRTAADNFLYSEGEKSDYDWLVTPPGSPSKSLTKQLDAPDATPMALNSRLENYCEEDRDSTSSKNQTIGLKRPSSSKSSRSTSRHSTPARRSTPPATRSTTPTSRVTSTAARATLSSSSTSTSRSTSRPSTPTRRPSSSSGTSRTSAASRPTLTSFSTSSARSTSRPSTPTSRPSTPTRRPSSSGISRANLTNARATTGTAASTRSNIRPMTAPSTKPGSRSSTPTPTGSSTVLRSKPTKPVCKPAPSPTLRSRPWEPYEMPGFSLEAPPNLRTTLPDRPQTASSRRTMAFGASSSRSASIERTAARRQSCSPSRNRAPIGNANGTGPLLRGRGAKKSNDDGGLISPVAKGNQMVERVTSVRKLAPPRLTENGGSNAGKSTPGADGFGFGRNLSKSSFDMAVRHMDIKQGNMKGNFRQLVTKVPAASLYSVRSSGTRRKRPASSSGSSESSSINILCLDGNDDNLSDISY